MKPRSSTRRRWIRAVLSRVALVACCLTPAIARATTGGPILSEVLGWDPIDHKVYVLLYAQGESGYPPLPAYFSMNGASTGRAIFARGTTTSWRDTSDTHALRLLRRRLVPLERLVAPSVPRTSVVATDTVNLCLDRHPRYRVRVSELPSIWSGHFDIYAFRSPQVWVLSVWAIPGRSERLAIVAYIGTPCESGYEYQVPVILPREGDALSPLDWKPFK